MNAVVAQSTVRTQPVAAARSDTNPFVVLIERAIFSNEVDAAKLEQLYVMKKDWDAEQREIAADEARKAFIAAMVGFKKLAPAILKDTHVEYDAESGELISYDHESLGAVCDAVIPALATCGITHSWLPLQEGGKITIACRLEHTSGHTETRSLYAAPDDSPDMNAIQAVASTVKYLERYTLLLACGVASKAMIDDDGRGAGLSPAAAAVAAKVPAVDKPGQPEGYAAFADGLHAKAKQGVAQFQAAWKAAAPEMRAYLATCQSARWEGLKKLSEAARP